MSRIGMMIRSAKTKATTPPKLMPPFQSTAARGTLPTEHTKLSSEITGPINGPQTCASTGWLVKKKLCQNDAGTHAASVPAIRSPRPMSVQTEVTSPQKLWLIAVRPPPADTRFTQGATAFDIPYSPSPYNPPRTPP